MSIYLTQLTKFVLIIVLFSFTSFTFDLFHFQLFNITWICYFRFYTQQNLLAFDTINDERIRTSCLEVQILWKKKQSNVCKLQTKLNTYFKWQNYKFCTQLTKCGTCMKQNTICSTDKKISKYTTKHNNHWLLSDVQVTSSHIQRTRIISQYLDIHFGNIQTILYDAVVVWWSGVRTATTGVNALPRQRRRAHVNVWQPREELLEAPSKSLKKRRSMFEILRSNWSVGKAELELLGSEEQRSWRTCRKAEEESVVEGDRWNEGWIRNVGESSGRVMIGGTCIGLGHIQRHNRRQVFKH